MSTLAAVIVLLAAAGVVCAVFNIAYNPEEYEYEDMRPDEPGLDMISHEEARRKMREGERHD
jgi:hypothetical protein